MIGEDITDQDEEEGLLPAPDEADTDIRKQPIIRYVDGVKFIGTAALTSRVVSIISPNDGVYAVMWNETGPGQTPHHPV